MLISVNIKELSVKMALSVPIRASSVNDTYQDLDRTLSQFINFPPVRPQIDIGVMS